MDVFHYPDAARERRHGPQGYSSYESYKPWLRDEFAFQCVYCLCRELWFPDGEAAFSADHLQPVSLAPEGENQYDNLVYACCQCNSQRGAAAVPDPCEHPYGRHVQVLHDGAMAALTPLGTELIDICRLNRERLILFRKRMLETLAILRQHEAAEAQSLAQIYLGYPAALPNLKVLRPPGGNQRAEGVGQSHYARRERGALPEVY